MLKEAILLVLFVHSVIQALPLEPAPVAALKAQPKAEYDMMETAETKYKGGGGGGGGGTKVYVVKSSGGGGHGGHYGGGGGHYGGGGGCCKGGYKKG